MPSEQELNSLMSTYGVSSTGFSFNWPNIFGGIIFGIIGWFAFSYGRKNQAYKPLSIGLVLMVYPYFVSNTWLLYAIGIAISSLLYFWKD
jgi:hypothetical protein